MRLTIIACLTAIALGSPAALADPLANPMCSLKNGVSIACGDPGAKPLGADEIVLSPASRVLPGLMLIVGLIGLFALLPEFEGWDRQEGDEDEAD
ncbi:MAG: hypothetical protein GC155_03585 [Alphaproteobacteria bacterium]|nr:hypothetical protein [Alphaproteobacteria bacterium]